MISEERKAILVQELNVNGYVHVAEMAKKLQITAATIRRDLSMLESQGICNRKRGGAVRTAQGVSFEPAFDVKRIRFEDQKRLIAEAAQKLVLDGNAIILDAGSTTYALALQLLQRKNLKVVTNDLKIAVSLASNPNIHTIVTGGTARRYVFSLQGPQSEIFIKNLRVDQTFLGADAIHADGSIYNVNLDEVPIKQAMIAAASQVILVADSSKFEKTGFAKVCDLSQIDLVITDRNLPAEKLELIRSLNVPVVCV